MRGLSAWLGEDKTPKQLTKMVHFAIFSVLTDFGKWGAEPPLEGCPHSPLCTATDFEKYQVISPFTLLLVIKTVKLNATQGMLLKQIL